MEEYLRSELSSEPPTLNGNEEDNVCEQNAQEKILKNEEEVLDGIVRIGKNYQAIIPDLIPKSERITIHFQGSTCTVPSDKEGICVWNTPATTLNNEEIDHYINTAQSIHEYSMEQALGLLSYCKHNIFKAYGELNNYMPNPKSENIWSSKEETLFEDALKVNGKDFVCIQHVLPHKSLQALVRYYYLSKKIIGRVECKKRKKRPVKSVNNNKRDNFANTNGFKVCSKMHPQVNAYLQPAKEYMSLKVIDENNEVIQFKIKKHIPLEYLMNAYCDQEKLVLAETCFQFNGQPINNKETPSSLQMKEGDIIEVGRVQTYFVPPIKQSLLMKKIETMRLNILGPDNVVVRFKTTKHSPLKDLMTRYCRRTNLPVASAQFRFDGVAVREHHTPASLNMNEKDNTINVFKDTN